MSFSKNKVVKKKVTKEGKTTILKHDELQPSVILFLVVETEPKGLVNNRYLLLANI